MFYKKAVLKNFAHSQESTCVGIRAWCLIKMQATGVFCEHWEIFKNTYFEEHLRTAASEIFTWTFPCMNKQHRKWRRRFLKNKTKHKPFKNSAIWKKLVFSWWLYHCAFRFFFNSVRRHLPYIIKIFWKSLTNEPGPIHKLFNYTVHFVLITWTSELGNAVLYHLYCITNTKFVAHRCI